jgi:hypothetical protein
MKEKDRQPLLNQDQGRIFMDWLPPIRVLHISDGVKVIPHKELFLIQSYSTKVSVGIERKSISSLMRLIQAIIDFSYS